jgi:hypothetical protein
MLRVAANFPEDKSMDNGSALDMDAHDINPVALERALAARRSTSSRSLPWSQVVTSTMAVAVTQVARDCRPGARC